MQYDKNVLDGLDILNTVLEDIGKPKVFENDDIYIGGWGLDWNFNNALRLSFDKKSEKFLYLVVDIIDGIEIHTNELNEALWFSMEKNNHKEAAVKWLKMLLTSKIKLECYYGKHCSVVTEMYFYDNNGICIDTIKRTIPLMPKFILRKILPCKTIWYEPFYETE